jgi:ABC-type dipeptide/oligopeptide/nickel transport system ATPase component
MGKILNLLLDLRDEFGLTMDFISHNLRIARRLAARIVVMFGGRIVGRIPREWTSTRRNIPTWALLEAAPSLGMAEALERSEEGVLA